MKWLKSKWLWVGVLILFLLVTFVKSQLNDVQEGLLNKPHYLNRSYSLKEARERGTLVAEFIASPMTCEVGNTTVTMVEAWLEENLRASHFLVWFPVIRHDGYVLCFRVEERVNGSDHGRISYQSKDIDLYQSQLLNFARISDRDLKSIEVLVVNDKEKVKEEQKILLNRK